MSDKIMEAGFDHPCRQTCSGWRQGYERGKFEVGKERDELKAEVDCQKSITVGLTNACDVYKERCERLRIGHEAMTANDQMTFGDLYTERTELKAELQQTKIDLRDVELGRAILRAEVERLKELIAVQDKELENSEVSHDKFSKEIQSLKDIAESYRAKYLNACDVIADHGIDPDIFEKAFPNIKDEALKE